ncbi:hypothetical protein SAMN05444166_6698 [Singulisphaera sp. GP187]|nr:hypothetical protein SAMN05444166_6698 [Singulisphaera sp. GP187]
MTLLNVVGFGKEAKLQWGHGSEAVDDSAEETNRKARL